jgi:DNA-binding MarR family transcriptional regulator
MAEGPNELAGSLQRFGLARDRMRAALAKRTGVGETDLDALEYLEAEGPLTQRDLADRLSLTSGAITMLVDRLEHAGWVTRGPHPTDRRYTVLGLTPRVVEASPSELDRYHRAIVELAKAVPAGQRRAVAAFLAQAADAASAAAADLAT